MSENRTESDIIRDSTALSAKACCGCGIVNMGVGPLRFRMTREAFLAYFEELQGLASQMRGDRTVSMPYIELSAIKGMS